MLRFPVWMGQGKAVFNRIASRVVVGRIVNFLIDDRLNLRILRGINLQSAAEQKIGRLRVSIAELLFECFGDLADQLVRVIGVRCLIFLERRVDILDTGVDVVRQSFLLFIFCDLALLIHCLQNDLAPGGICLRAADRIQL